MTKPLTKMAKKEEKSIECLVLPEKSNRWQKFKSSYMRKVSRKLGTHPGPVTTISKRTSSTTQTMSSSSNKSCRGKYFCCFCYKCKLKKRSFVLDPSSENPRKSRCPPELPRWPCKTGFESLFRKPACYRKKKKSKKLETQSTASTPEGVTCVSVSTPERCCCSPYQTSMIECLRILCCWNSSFCVKLRCKCDKWCSSCKKCCLCCKRNEKTAIAETERRRSNVSQIRKPSWTRVFTDFPKLDPSFVDHVSVMRGAIPVLPVPLAWICLILNVFLPGFGTLSSGIFCLFVGKPRFSINDSLASRFGSFLLNLLVACSQLFTVLFCLVGWGWSVWWGVIILRMAKRSKRIMMAEQGPPPVSTLNMKNRDLERGAAT